MASGECSDLLLKQLAHDWARHVCASNRSQVVIRNQNFLVTQHHQQSNLPDYVSFPPPDAAPAPSNFFYFYFYFNVYFISFKRGYWRTSGTSA